MPSTEKRAACFHCDKWLICTKGDKTCDLEICGAFQACKCKGNKACPDCDCWTQGDSEGEMQAPRDIARRFFNLDPILAREEADG